MQAGSSCHSFDTSFGGSIALEPHAYSAYGNNFYGIEQARFSDKELLRAAVAMLPYRDDGGVRSRPLWRGACSISS